MHGALSEMLMHGDAWSVYTMVTYANKRLCSVVNYIILYTWKEGGGGGGGGGMAVKHACSQPFSN